MRFEERLKKLRPRPAAEWNPLARTRRTGQKEAMMSLAAAGLIAALVLALAPSRSESPFPAQDRPPADPLLDPAPITAPIASWYRLDRRQGSDWVHAGYASEMLIPVGGKPWAFDYAYDLAFILPRADEQLTGGRFSITAQLDKAFEAVTLDGFLALREGGGRSLKMKSLDETRELEVFTGEGLVRIRKSIDDPATPIPSLMLYSAFRTRNLYDQSVLRFIDVWGADRLVSLSAAVSKPAKRTVLGHEATVIDVELKTMSALFPELPALTKFTLDRFGRIIHGETADGTLRLVLVASEEEATKGDAMMKDSNRRDPFTKVGRPTAATLEVQLPPAPRVTSVDESLARAEALLKALREDILAHRDPAAADHYANLVAVYRELWTRAQGTQRSTLDWIRLDAEAVYGGVKRVVARAHALHDTINDFVNALMIPEAAAKMETLKSIEDLPALWRQEERTEITKLIASASESLDRGRAMVELAAKKLVVTGMVVAEPAKTYAVINGKNVRVGDRIDGVKVEAINRNFVTVSLRGVTRDLTLAK